VDSGICLTRATRAPLIHLTRLDERLADLELQHDGGVHARPRRDDRERSQTIQIDDGITRSPIRSRSRSRASTWCRAGRDREDHVPNKRVRRDRLRRDRSDRDHRTSQTAITCNGADATQFSLSQVSGTAARRTASIPTAAPDDRSLEGVREPQSAVNANDSTVTIRNTFFYSNGNTGYSNGA